MGVAVPSVSQARVLEVGCGDGTNVIPMAAALPAARFVGCDLSERALAAGRRTIDALGLSNIALVQDDLRTLPLEDGDFDFIIAHGVYSWVPHDVAEKVLDAVVNIAAASDMMTTAEGVETEQQRNLLFILGCNEMQGHLFSPAVSAADVRRLLFSHRGKAMSAA